MSTSNEKRRGSLAPLRVGSAPLLACLAILATGCGGGSGAVGTIDPGPDPGEPTEAPPQPLSAPAIAAVDPQVGPAAGGTVLTVVGTGFVEGVEGPVTVQIGGQEAQDIQVIDDEMLTCLTPPGTPEASVDVEVTNSRGRGMLGEGFTYLGLPGLSTDLNGDGIADLVVSAQLDGTTGLNAGSVYVFYGQPPTEPLLDMNADSAHVKIRGAAAGDRFGRSVASCDVNGDGTHDLLIGASHVDSSVLNSGAVYVFFGPLPDSADLSALEADAILTGEEIVKDDFFGSSMAAGDVDGDGFDDILVGAPGADFAAGTSQALLDAGAAYLFYGSAEFGSGPAAGADLIVRGNQAADWLGNACLVADLNGDGLDDVTIAAHRASPNQYYEAGAAYVFLAGPDLAGGRAWDASLIFTGEHQTDEFGTSLASGDMNGDEIQDLMVGATGSNAHGSETGRVYLFLGGPQLAGRGAAQADAIFSGQQLNANFGQVLTAADINGDGFDDLAIGAPHDSFGANRNGRCYVFLGAAGPQDGMSGFADVILNGESQYLGRFASSLEVIDLDCDGLADLVSAAVGSGDGAGRVHVFAGMQVLEDRNAVDDDHTLTGESGAGNFGSSLSRGM